VKIAVLAAAVAAGIPVVALAAGETTLVSSANPSYEGQQVTLTATYTVYCADGASTAFTIDGQPVRPVISGAHTFTATVQVASLAAGRHSVAFAWHADQPGTDVSCGGSATLTQVVLVRPSPKPKPPPPTSAAPPSASPSPSPQTSPAESPSPVASAPRVSRTAMAQPGVPDPAVSAGALAIYLLVAVAALAVSRRF